MRALLDLVLMDFYECSRDKLLVESKIKEWMITAAKLMGAEVVANSFHTFKPWGVSGTVTIAESHLAIHTWPEYDFAAVTFETCGHRMDHKRAYKYLVNALGSKRSTMIHQKRGFIEGDAVIAPVKQGGEILCPP